MKQLVYKKWISSDEWSGIEDAGFSLHLTVGDFFRFAKQYWDSMPPRAPSFYVAPDIYSGPKTVEVDDETYAQVEASDCGIRFNGVFGEVVQ